MAVRGVAPGIVRNAKSARMISVQSYWNHWPCLLHPAPARHGKLWAYRCGPPKQRGKSSSLPLIRGLIHSDGCRAINRVVVRGKAYSYPRYFFGNESPDILAIMGRALDSVGVAWRFNRRNSISIARRDAVTTMDAHVGRKS